MEFYTAGNDPSGFGGVREYIYRNYEGASSDGDATTTSYGPGPVNGIAQGADTTTRFSFNIPLGSFPEPVVPGVTQISAKGDYSPGAGNTFPDCRSSELAHPVTITGVLTGLDYGDRDVNDGAASVITSARYLGRCADSEPAFQVSAGADGDDLGPGVTTVGTCATAGDDEDGVTFGPFVENRLSDINLAMDTDCFVSAWFDWNKDGLFTGPGENYLQDEYYQDNGSVVMNWAMAVVPPAGTAGPVRARFRCNSYRGIGPTDVGIGEVEDYLVTVMAEPTYSLGSFVWDDTDGDGIQDSGEPGLGGVTVNLYSGSVCGGAPLSSAVTAGGNYSFPGLARGDYCVEFVAPAGREHTHQTVGNDHGSDADPNGHALVSLATDRADIDAGFVTPTLTCTGGTDIGGVVFREFEMNGDADGATTLVSGLSQERDDLANPDLLPTFFGTTVGISTFVGGNDYAEVGEDRHAIRRDEWGFAGVTVTLYGPGSTLLGSTTTDSQGAWSLAHGQAAGTPLLVEFSGWPAWMDSGPKGLDNETSVQRLTVTGTAGDCATNFTVANPADHCSDDPRLAFACFVGEEGSAGGNPNFTQDALVDIAWTAGDPWVFKERGLLVPPTSPGGMTWGSHQNDEEFWPSTPLKNSIASVSQVGTIYGVAHDSKRDVVYSSSYFRRNAPVGTYGLGAIFKDSSLWLDVADALGIAVDFPPVCDVDGDGFADDRCVNDVGFVGLGDLEISDDNDTLFTVNLRTQEVLAIPILSDGNPDIANIKRFQAPEPAQCGTDNPGGFSRTRNPFALGYHEERLYVGVTCTDNIDSPRGNPLLSSTAGPHGFIFSFDPQNPPATPGYNLEVSTDLTYSKHGWAWQWRDFGGSINWFSAGSYEGWQQGVNPDNWGNQTFFYDSDLNGFPDEYPLCSNISRATGDAYQPWVTDIEFDVRPDGTDDIIMGVRNRVADLHSNNSCTNAGGMIRFCETGAGAGSWTRETFGTGVCGTGTNQLQPGTGVGETRNISPFGADAPMFFYDNGAEGRFPTGSLAGVPGFVELAVPGTDNINRNQHSGISWLSLDDGAHERASTLVGFTTTFAEFGKANNWGDIEAICPAPDLEVGNYIWFDTGTANGLQDPDENPASGVTVQLYLDPNGDGQLSAAEMTPANLVATDITGPDGQYLFTNADGVTYDSDYVVVIPASNFTGGGALVGFEDTGANLGGTDTRDSDGVDQPASVLGTAFSTGGPGENDHKYDFGFVAAAAEGNLQVTKSVTGATAGYTGGTFTINVDCDDGTAHDATMNLANGASQTITGIPVGTNCTVSENTALNPAPSGGYVWQTPVIAPAQPVSITTVGATVAVTVSNPLLGPGAIRVNKTVTGASAPNPWQFTLSSTTTGCDISHVTPNPASTANGSGGFVLFNNLPVTNSSGSTCNYTVVETAQTGWTLNTGASSTLTGVTVTEGGTTTLGVQNDQQLGGIAVTKTVNGAPAPAPWQFTLTSTTAGCVIPGTVTNPASTADGSGGSVSFTGLPLNSSTTGAACQYTVSETAQAGYTLNTTASSTLTGIVPGTPNTPISVVNDQDPGAIQVTKSVVGADAPNGWQFTLSVSGAGCSIPGTVTNPQTTADGSGGSVTFSGLQVTGTSGACQYTVAETAQTGWTLNTGASSTLTGVTVTSGNTTNLTVQNDQDLGGIAVTKTVNGAAAPAAWQFTLTSTTAGCVIPGTVTNPASTADGSGGSVNFAGLPLRSSNDGSVCQYTVSETAQTGYTLNTTASSTLTGIVPATPNTAISVVNDQDPGAIQVTKSVVGADAPNGWEFTLSVSGAGCAIPGSVTNPVSTADGSGGVVSFTGLQVSGTSGACQYTVAETAQTGWTLNTGASSTLTGVTVTAGSTTNLTVQNDQDLGGIAVTKTVNGAAAPAAWQFTLTSTTAGCVIPGTVTNPASTADGSGGSVNFTGLPLRSSTDGSVCQYNVAETAQSGYTLNVTASSTLTGIVPSTPNTAISVVNDEDPGAIQVTKSVVGADAPAAWEFTLSTTSAGCSIPGTVTNPRQYGGWLRWRREFHRFAGDGHEWRL